MKKRAVLMWILVAFLLPANIYLLGKRAFDHSIVPEHYRPAEAKAFVRKDDPDKGAVSVGKTVFTFALDPDGFHAGMNVVGSEKYFFSLSSRPDKNILIIGDAAYADLGKNGFFDTKSEGSGKHFIAFHGKWIPAEILNNGTQAKTADGKLFVRSAGTGWQAK